MMMLLTWSRSFRKFFSLKIFREKRAAVNDRALLDNEEWGESGHMPKQGGNEGEAVDFLSGYEDGDEM